MRCLLVPFVAFGLSLVSALQYRGADFSSLPFIESTSNIKFSTSSGATPQPFEQILSVQGVNLARIRVWTSGTYNTAYGLALAKRAKAAGMDLLVDLFYCDTWTDPGSQTIPDGWPTDLDGLVSQVYSYTYQVVESFEAQGTPIKFIQLGNEINDGTFWPTGRITTNGFTGASKLLHAGALAVHTASPSTQTLIHLSNGWDLDLVSWFYAGIFNHTETETGVGGLLTPSDLDVMGFSFYPFYGTDATFSNLNSSLTYLVSKYNKDIMIVETDWPVECDTRATPLSEALSVDVQGQIEWTKTIGSVLGSLQNGKGLGLVYYEPQCVWNPKLNSDCADNLLVSTSGVAIPLGQRGTAGYLPKEGKSDRNI